MLVLLMVELTDIVFAVDSILAIFAITTDRFIVFTSNVFAVMGMRSRFFLLSSMAKRFVYLQPGLALVLVFVGGKMAVMRWLEIPVIISLAVVTLLLGGSIIASIIKTQSQKGPQLPLPVEVIPCFRQEPTTPTCRQRRRPRPSLSPFVRA